MSSILNLQLRREGRVSNVSDVVNRSQKVKVKVLSFTGQKTSLSIKVSQSQLSGNMVYKGLFSFGSLTAKSSLHVYATLGLGELNM